MPRVTRRRRSGLHGEPGPIGTVPRYDGKPRRRRGPGAGLRAARGSDGGFSYGNGSRLYYASLASAVPGTQPFKGYEAITVSHTDNPQAGATEGAAGEAWSKPVIASRQSGAQFSDKEQIWADNASTSAFFGNVYVCYAGFRGDGSGNQPLAVLTSRDAGTSWTQKQVTPATNNTSSRNGFGRRAARCGRTQGRRLRVRLRVRGLAGGRGPGQIQMVKSFDGGKTFDPAAERVHRL